MNNKIFSSFSDLGDLRDGVTYLATPYSATDDELSARRWQRTTQFAAKMETVGCTVISPVTQNRVVAAVGEMPENWGVWKSSCLRLLEKCDYVLVVDCREIPGAMWESVGVQSEIRAAQEADTPVWAWNWNLKRFMWTQGHQDKHEEWLRYPSLRMPSSDPGVEWSEGVQPSIRRALRAGGRTQWPSGLEPTLDSTLSARPLESESDSL